MSYTGKSTRVSVVPKLPIEQPDVSKGASQTSSSEPLTPREKFRIEYAVRDKISATLKPNYSTSNTIDASPCYEPEVNYNYNKSSLTLTFPQYTGNQVPPVQSYKSNIVRLAKESNVTFSASDGAHKNQIVVSNANGFLVALGINQRPTKKSEVTKADSNTKVIKPVIEKTTSNPPSITVFVPEPPTTHGKKDNVSNQQPGKRKAKKIAKQEATDRLLKYIKDIKQEIDANVIILAPAINLTKLDVAELQMLSELATTYGQIPEQKAASEIIAQYKALGLQVKVDWSKTKTISALELSALYNDQAEKHMILAKNKGISPTFDPLVEYATYEKFKLYCDEAQAIINRSEQYGILKFDTVKNKDTSLFDKAQRCISRANDVVLNAEKLGIVVKDGDVSLIEKAHKCILEVRAVISKAQNLGIVQFNPDDKGLFTKATKCLDAAKVFLLKNNGIEYVGKGDESIPVLDRCSACKKALEVKSMPAPALAKPTIRRSSAPEPLKKINVAALPVNPSSTDTSTHPTDPQPTATQPAKDTEIDLVKLAEVVNGIIGRAKESKWNHGYTKVGRFLSFFMNPAPTGITKIRGLANTYKNNIDSTNAKAVAIKLKTILEERISANKNPQTKTHYESELSTLNDAIAGHKPGMVQAVS